MEFSGESLPRRTSQEGISGREVLRESAAGGADQTPNGGLFRVVAEHWSRLNVRPRVHYGWKIRVKGVAANEEALGSVHYLCCLDSLAGRTCGCFVCSVNPVEKCFVRSYIHTY